MLYYLKILVLAVVQGVAELLPVSSSAHVIMAEKLMGLDPASPDMTLLLVMLHTGTMFAVILYFWRAWLAAYFSSLQAFKENAINIVLATAITAVVGLSLQWLIKHFYAADQPGFEIEQLFGNLQLVATGLAAAGLVIIGSSAIPDLMGKLTVGRSAIIGAVQGLCLPFRGFSRSGATISTGLMTGVSRKTSEEFSFALAVVLTPPVIAREVLRLVTHKAAAVEAGAPVVHLSGMILPGLIGMVFSFGAGLLALRWLSAWLGSNRWHFFGYYCLAAAIFCYWLSL